VEPAIFGEFEPGLGAVGLSLACNRGVSNDTRFALNLTGLLLVVLAVLAGVIGSFVYAMQPGNGGAVVLTMLVACIGYGFVREGMEQVSRSEWEHPVRR
jgi:hypothetical protein